MRSCVLLLTIADFSGADEINSQDVPEERGYCAEKGIRCDDIQLLHWSQVQVQRQRIQLRLQKEVKPLFEGTISEFCDY
uniref:U37-Lycotoxin-Lsp1b_1 n=1 Tax=Lycosa sp. SGP-2016 TaxID=1905177 RepID=A0A482Z819_9ARAC